MDDQDLLVLPSPGIPGIPRRRSSHTYVRRDLASPRNFVREIRCGSGALSVRDAEGLGRRLRFRGLPFAPVYNDDRAENGYLAGHAHPHYTIEEARGPPRRVVVVTYLLLPLPLALPLRSAAQRRFFSVRRIRRRFP